MDIDEIQQAILRAQQAVAVINGRLKMRLRPEDERVLVSGIVKSGAYKDLVFHNRMVSAPPPWWSLSGLMARLAMIWFRLTKGRALNDNEQLRDLTARVRRSGAPRLTIALLIALLCGAINFGAPAELQLQVVRDKLRPMAASGDIVVIAKDEKSKRVFGQLPWARRHDAALLDRLREAGAKTIVFNDPYANATDTANDQAFAAALDRAKGKVWLGAQYEENAATADRVPILPISLFRSKAHLAHSHIFVNSFGITSNFPNYVRIANKNYPSSASILATIDLPSSDLRPDTAIDYSTIPTISAVDILRSRVDRQRIARKAVIINEISNATAASSIILGQGQAPNVYSRVLAAETIKNGVARELGWLPALAAALMIGMACVLSGSRKARGRVIVLGTIAMFVVMVIADRSGFHFEMVPGLLALAIFGVRDAMKGQLIDAATSDPVSGLPSINQLRFVKGHQNCLVGALKVERFGQYLNLQNEEEQRKFVRAIASRINIVCAESVVHQGDNGLFVWLIKPTPEIDTVAIGRQIQALFRLFVGGSYQGHDVGVSTGFGKNLDEPFAARLAVAVDRASLPVFVTLRSVQ